MRADGDGSAAEALLRSTLAQLPEQAATRDIAAANAMLTGAEIPDPARH
jgi:hypothetical protein